MTTQPNIGRWVQVVQDEARAEWLVEAGGTRTFPVSVHYPVDPDWVPARPSTMLDLFAPLQEQVVALFKEAGLEEAHVRGLPSSVYDGAPLAAGGAHPVVVLSPGLGIDRDQYLTTIAALVQAGFLVVTVQAKGVALLSVYPDTGTLVRQAEKVGAIGPTDFDKLNELVHMQAADVRRTIDQLAVWNAEGPLAGRFDLSRIALLGHSLGGAAMLAVAEQDDRAGALVVFDMSHHLPTYEQPLSLPVLCLRQQAATYEELLAGGMVEDVARPYVDGMGKLHDIAEGVRVFAKVNGANHVAFSSLPWLFGAPESLVEVQAAIDGVTVAFLRAYLLGETGAYEHEWQANRGTAIVAIDRTGTELS